jgi:hypothetical protein
MANSIFQRPSTTLNGNEQSDNNQETTNEQSSNYHSHKSFHISYDNQSQKTTIRRTASERVAPDEGRFTTTYTALTL